MLPGSCYSCLGFKPTRSFNVGCTRAALQHPSTHLVLYGRYAVIPAYLYSAWSLVHSLRSSGQPALLALGGAAAACITLVPAQLVEFRYDLWVLCKLAG